MGQLLEFITPGGQPRFREPANPREFRLSGEATGRGTGGGKKREGCASRVYLERFDDTQRGQRDNGRRVVGLRCRFGEPALLSLSRISIANGMRLCSDEHHSAAQPSSLWGKKEVTTPVGYLMGQILYPSRPYVRRGHSAYPHTPRAQYQNLSTTCDRETWSLLSPPSPSSSLCALFLFRRTTILSSHHGLLSLQKSSYPGLAGEVVGRRLL